MSILYSDRCGAKCVVAAARDEQQRRRSDQLVRSAVADLLLPVVRQLSRLPRRRHRSKRLSGTKQLTKGRTERRVPFFRRTIRTDSSNRGTSTYNCRRESKRCSTADCRTATYIRIDCTSTPPHLLVEIDDVTHARYHDMHALSDVLRAQNAAEFIAPPRD